MNKMILNIALVAAAMTSLTACSDDDPVLTQRDWDGTTDYFASSDLQRQDIYYKPAVGYVGDPMPFYDPVEKDFKILYLQDFRPNPAYTYHPIWCLSTQDAASYTSLGEVIPCGSADEIDAAIGTGSTIYENGVYYTFYTGHSADASKTGGFGEAVRLATSTDFRNWEKNRSLLITGGTTYSTSDFRDPLVFKGDDSQYHMLISTKLNGKGVLAEFVSADLLNWRDNGVFMTMMWDRFYECPDLFKMGEWWYLIYSEQHDAIRKVQYFKGRTLDELKACTANDAGLWPDSHEGFLDSRGLYAGKTASNGTDRYIWGWCATRSGDSNLGSNDWAGNLVAHKLIQHEDGTLTLGEVPAIANKFGQGSALDSFSLSGDSYKLMGRLGYTNRISFTVTLDNPADKFGISLARGGDSSAYYTLVVNPEGETNRKINFEEEGTDGSGFIANADSYLFAAPTDGVYNITMVTDNSVVTFYINDVLAYTNRVYGLARNCWSINTYGGSLSVTNLRLATL
jgi:beta-fructofuranosidase